MGCESLLQILKEARPLSDPPASPLLASKAVHASAAARGGPSGLPRAAGGLHGGSPRGGTALLWPNNGGRRHCDACRLRAAADHDSSSGFRTLLPLPDGGMGQGRRQSAQLGAREAAVAGKGGGAGGSGDRGGTERGRPAKRACSEEGAIANTAPPSMCPPFRLPPSPPLRQPSKPLLGLPPCRPYLPMPVK